MTGTVHEPRRATTIPLSLRHEHLRDRQYIVRLSRRRDQACSLRSFALFLHQVDPRLLIDDQCSRFRFGTGGVQHERWLVEERRGRGGGVVDPEIRFLESLDFDGSTAITTTILGVLTNVLPGKLCAETVDFASVMSNEEDEVLGGEVADIIKTLNLWPGGSEWGLHECTARDRNERESSRVRLAGSDAAYDVFDEVDGFVVQVLNLFKCEHRGTGR